MEAPKLPFDIRMVTEISQIDDSLDSKFKVFLEKINSKDKKALINEKNKQEMINKFVNGESLYSLAKRYNINPLDLMDNLTDIKISKPEHMKKYIENVISFYIGVIFGKYSNIEFNTKDDGILPIDSSIYSENILEKIYECIEITFGKQNFEQVIDEIEEVLGTSIEDYLIKEFSEVHFKKFEKRPIYWHICSPKKTFNCFVYYHKLDDDTLYKVKGIYLSQMIDRYQEDLNYYTEQLIKARTDGEKKQEKDFKEKVDDLEEKLEDLNNLDQSIMEILPYKPDIDEGVLHNIIPLEPILSSTISTKGERESYYEEDVK